ncbi:muconolactone Delta-isomerase [Aquabacterium sp. OR-4]|uniref:muconolactone Delta-isomerase n=1 Tax=Aquabacterium sp. OR-4 TaxID=2978127 RepID=UPI0028C7FC59|nr:muconolactone Delta-isomerase [Aquabacterium sp. OR-4]MDT7838567.1 muconolactone Delta-isomerase [Aquabacterium sp. OR-4]
MLYLVHMQVELPPDMPPAQAQAIKDKEKAYSQELQRQGRWLHLWRVVGEYANYSVFDAPDHDTLHQWLAGLPLFPYMRLKVTPLAQHPSAIR